MTAEHHHGSCQCGAVAFEAASTSRSPSSATARAASASARSRLHAARELPLLRGEDALTEYPFNRHASGTSSAGSAASRPSPTAQMPDGTPDDGDQRQLPRRRRPARLPEWHQDGAAHLRWLPAGLALAPVRSDADVAAGLQSSPAPSSPTCAPPKPRRVQTIDAYLIDQDFEGQLATSATTSTRRTANACSPASTARRPASSCSSPTPPGSASSTGCTSSAPPAASASAGASVSR